MEIKPLENKNCWEILKRPTNQQVMHTNFVLKQKKDEQGSVCIHESHLAVCKNEETDCTEETFSLVAHYFIIEVILSLSVQKGGTTRHLDIENAFPHGYFDRPVYAEWPRRLFTTAHVKGKGIRLCTSLYKLKNEARVWTKLLFRSFTDLGLKGVKAALCFLSERALQ